MVLGDLNDYLKDIKINYKLTDDMPNQFKFNFTISFNDTNMKKLEYACDLILEVARSLKVNSIVKYINLHEISTKKEIKIAQIAPYYYVNSSEQNYEIVDFKKNKGKFLSLEFKNNDLYLIMDKEHRMQSDTKIYFFIKDTATGLVSKKIKILMENPMIVQRHQIIFKLGFIMLLLILTFFIIFMIINFIIELDQSNKKHKPSIP